LTLGSTFTPTSLHDNNNCWLVHDDDREPQPPLLDLSSFSMASQILLSKRVRFVVVASMVAATILFFISAQRKKLNIDYIYNPFASALASPPHGIDWSRYAYTQYATDTKYLCNSVMLFETLHRLGSKADRLLMYPSSIHPDPEANDNLDSRLLLKAQSEYGVKLQPVQVQHRSGGDRNVPSPLSRTCTDRLTESDSATWADSYTKLLAFNQTQYDRVLSLDSDATVLQHMDELFLLPTAPVAMPRAYWLSEESTLSSQLVLIQPTAEEFKRVTEAIDSAKSGEFDMEIVNNLYSRDCLILPHRRYDLLTGEFRNGGNHTNYLGNDYEAWDPEEVLREAKFLHFSDWPMPKPWLTASAGVQSEVQPKCVQDSEGKEDCRARDIWLRFYSDFKERREASLLSPGHIYCN
jgi:alpha-N-acetylglucosamine transferase